MRARSTPLFALPDSHRSSGRAAWSSDLGFLPVHSRHQHQQAKAWRNSRLRLRSLPVSFDSAVNANGGGYFSMLSLAGVGVDCVQAETLNRLTKQLGQSSGASPEARKAVSIALASCQTTLKKLVAAPENAGDDANVSDLKKQLQSDLPKAKAALKQLQEIP